MLYNNSPARADRDQSTLYQRPLFAPFVGSYSGVTGTGLLTCPRIGSVVRLMDEEQRDIFGRKEASWEVFPGESAANSRPVIERAVLSAS